VFTTVAFGVRHPTLAHQPQRLRDRPRTRTRQLTATGRPTEAARSWPPLALAWRVVQVVLHDVMVRLDDEATSSETTVSTAGPWAITLITVVPELGLRFISSYVGGETILTSAVHALTYRAGGRLEQREHVRDELPVTHAR
jgi:hypothetical protein